MPSGAVMAAVEAAAAVEKRTHVGAAGPAPARITAAHVVAKIAGGGGAASLTGPSTSPPLQDIDRREGQTTMVKTVGKYQIGKTLGEGTFGKVKFAINTETGESVAIKVLDKEKIQKQSMGAQVGGFDLEERSPLTSFVRAWSGAIVVRSKH